MRLVRFVCISMAVFFMVSTISQLSANEIPINAKNTNFPTAVVGKDVLLAINEAMNSAWNSHDINKLLTFFADDAVWDYVPLMRPAVGKGEITGIIKAMFSFMPDLSSTQNQVLVSGNMIVTECVITGTASGSWMGLPPSGNKLSLMQMNVYEFDGEKIIKKTTYEESMSMMMQQGYLPVSPLPPLVPPYKVPDPEPTNLSPVDAFKEGIARWNTHDLKEWGKMVYPNVDILLPSLGKSINRDEFIAAEELFYFQAFSDVSLDINRVTDLGDGWALGEAVLKGTQNGTFLGVPATGRSIALKSGFLYRFDASGIETNAHIYYDTMTAFVQIGAAQPLSGVSQAFAGGMSEVNFWSCKAPEGANYFAYFFDSDLPALKGACLKSPKVMTMADGSYLAEGEIIAADGKSTVFMSSNGNDKGDVFTLYGGTGVFANLFLAGYGVTDPKTGIAYHWGYYSYDMTALHSLPLGLAEKKDGLTRFVLKCKAVVDPNDPTFFGQTYESELPVIKNAKYYIQSNQSFSNGDALLKGIAKCEDGSTFNWNLHFIPQVGISVWMTYNGTGSSKGLRTIWFTPPEPNFFKVGLSDHESLYYYDSESPLVMPELPFMQIVAPIQHPGKDYTNTFFLALNPGLNMISLPLEPSKSYTARSFAEMLNATVVIRYDETSKHFTGFTINNEGEGFPINGGEGYIVNTPKGGTTAFVGAAWTNDVPLKAPSTNSSNSAWAFVVNGEIAGDGQYIVKVCNKTMGNTVIADTVDKNFSAVLADLSKTSVVNVGDKLEIVIADSKGNQMTENYIVTQDDINKAYTKLFIRPDYKTRIDNMLGQNYPNPFNPETWIPYQLKDGADVRIDIYTSSGQLVRSLNIGHKPSGLYTGMDKAAYWDGRNESGETVSSGLYFYNIQTGQYIATKKMIVKK